MVWEAGCRVTGMVDWCVYCDFEWNFHALRRGYQGQHVEIRTQNVIPILRRCDFSSMCATEPNLSRRERKFLFSISWHHRRRSLHQFFIAIFRFLDLFIPPRNVQRRLPTPSPENWPTSFPPFVFDVQSAIVDCCPTSTIWFHVITYQPVIERKLAVPREFRTLLPSGFLQKLRRTSSRGY